MTEQVVAPGPAPRGAGDLLAERLRGFGPVGILAILAIIFTGNIILSGLWVVPLGAGLVLLWAWRSRTPWRELGFVPPRNWLRTVAGAIAFGIVFKLAMKSIVMPLRVAIIYWDFENDVAHWVFN